MRQNVMRLLASAALVGGCAAEQTPRDYDLADIDVSVQEVRTGRSAGKNLLSLDMLSTYQGRALGCDDGTLDISVGIGSSPDGPFEELPGDAYEVRCTASEAPDVALVIDNSGSEQGYLEWLQEAAHVMTDAVMGRDGRSSLVRVSTDSDIRLGLTEDEEAIRGAIDELYILNGWTALYDGIRLGNETLGAAAATHSDYDSMDDFCDTDRKLAVVAFTDGNENNSANERLRSDEYPGDGIDTTLEDLHDLRVADVRTPIYTVGLGDEVDHGGLEELAGYTGGRHHRIDSAADLPATFEVISEYLASSVKVCTEISADICGHHYVRVEYTWAPCDDGTCDEVRDSYLQEIHVECPPAPPAGKVATVLLTLSNPGIDRDLAKTLASNTVNWVSPSADPRVIVVKDENHHGEFSQDADFVYELLSEAGFQVDFVDEPVGGISAADTAGYDVVWMSNPGYPFDDQSSMNALASFGQDGGGYVLQSDDGTRLSGDLAFAMSSFTGLLYENNGTSFCGRHIDNNATPDKYQVMINDSAHPVIAGLEGASFLYGNDIDVSSPADAGEEILAWANGVDASGEVFCEREIPVISVRTP